MVAAVHAHRNAQRQVGHRLRGLPNRTPIQNCKARRAKAHRHRFGVTEAREKRTAAMGAKRVGSGRQARGTGWERSGRSQHDVRRVHGDAHSAAQCRPPRVAAFGTAVCMDYGMATTALGVKRTAAGCKRRHAVVPPVRPLRQTGPFTYASLRARAVHCGCCSLVSHGHQRRRAA